MATNIRQATHLWIQAGELSGGARNQIELTDDLALFFTDVERTDEVITIRLPGGATMVRPLTYRGRDYGQWTEDIWRLGLPTARMGAPDYQGRIIMLERIPTNSSNDYTLDVEDVGSHPVSNWQAQAQSSGVVGKTGDTGRHPGREFGFW